MGKLMREVAIVGAGMSKFGAFPDKNSRDLFAEAFVNCLQSIDKNFEPKDIQALYLGNYSSDLFEGQGHLAPMCAELAGLTPKPALRTENVNLLVLLQNLHLELKTHVPVVASHYARV
ncbi:MAG: hypothetical protein ACTSPQ_17620 [Candidatus Helarchaeota archaeon]